MVDTINILLWHSSNKLEENVVDPIIEFEKKAARYFEDVINSSGGIGQKNIQIHLKDILHVEVGEDEFAQKAYQDHLENKDIIFARAPGFFAGSYEIQHNFLKKIFEPTRLLFSVRALPSDYDLQKLNVINTHSNLFSDPKKSFLERTDDLSALLNKNKVYHFANFTDKSPILAAKALLEDNDILLFRINKEKHVDNERLKEDVENFLGKSTHDDLISFGAIPFKIKANLFDILKNYQENRTIVTASVDRQTNTTGITNTILTKENANYDIYLSMENLFEKLGPNLTKGEKQICNSRFDQFEIPMMIKYICDKENLVFEDKKTFVKKIVKGINAINGENDVFIGRHKDYAFKKNINILKKSSLVEISTDNFSGSTAVKTLYKKQFNEVNNEIKLTSVIAINIDVERVSNISIEDGTFSAEFYMDLISCADSPIDSIKFNNLSTINPKFEIRKLNEERIDERYSGRYIITANFDFKSIGSNYPLDRQFIYIGVSPTNEFTQIQPIPEKFIDREFVVDGWHLLGAKCGINRQKSWITISDDLKRNPKINEELRIGWELKRSNSMTLLKIGIPLSFLYALLYYTLFLPPEQSGDAMEYLTVAFLSSIALYFSTERPQPLKMTTIDVVFAFFYSISSLVLFMIIFSEFFEAFYAALIYPLRIFLPLSLLGLAVFIKSRLKSNKFKPSITL